jgi:ubiquitin thioesterase OTU1
VVPIANDNSCLFNSVGGLLEGFDQCGANLVTELRQTVASVVQAASPDDERFSEAALNGLTRDAYAAHILQPHSWGGGIELAVLAEAWDVEIAALDVETCHQYVFGASDDPTQQKKRRIYLVYYGVHYDALEDRDVAGPPVRVFSPSDAVAEARALLAARHLQAAGSFTNVSHFTLRCATCEVGFVGAQEAQEHAKATGHTNFQEYKK